MADMEVVDLLDDSPPPAEEAERPPPTAEQLKEAIRAYLEGKDLSTISLKALRLELEQGLGVGPGGLDARKGEIRTTAQELVQEAQNAAAAAAAQAPAVEPAAKKRKALLAGGAATAVPGGDGVDAQATGKAPKRKAPPSAFNMWASQNREQVAKDLETELARKPTFGEVCKAVAERWKAVPQAERASLEEKAKVAKAEFAAELGTGQAGVTIAKAAKATAGRGRGGGKGKGKGRGRGSGPEAASSVLSRVDFLKSSPALRCVVSRPGAASNEPMATLDLTARLFKSGGAGFFQSVKFELPIGGREVTVTAQMVLNVAGSKYWEDGEGLAEWQASAQGSELGSGPATEDDPAARGEVEAIPEPVQEGAPPSEEAPVVEEVAEATAQPEADEAQVLSETPPPVEETAEAEAVEACAAQPPAVEEAGMAPEAEAPVEEGAPPEAEAEAPVEAGAPPEAEAEAPVEAAAEEAAAEEPAGEALAAEEAVAEAPPMVTASDEAPVAPGEEVMGTAELTKVLEEADPAGVQQDEPAAHGGA